MGEKVFTCPRCGHDLMEPEEGGQAGDDSYYCEGCGQDWPLDVVGGRVANVTETAITGNHEDTVMEQGCGFPMGDDVAGIPVYCGSLGRLCTRCKIAGAGADTREGSGFRDDEGVDGLGPVEGSTPAPDVQVWHGAVEILAAVKNVPFEHRLDAFALAFDAFVRTSGTIDVDYPEDRLDALWLLCSPRCDVRSGDGRRCKRDPHGDMRHNFVVAVDPLDPLGNGRAETPPNPEDNGRDRASDA